MRSIRLPEPHSSGMGLPDIFGGGVDVIRRAMVISNGATEAENQSIGLVRALGLADKLSIYRVTRPRGGVNEWLHWLPISLHKVLDCLIRQIFTDTRFAMSPPEMKSFPFSVQSGTSTGLLSILEEDGRKIASIASETYKKEGPLLIVACGRDTISIASSVKHLASEKVFVIQVQHPRSCLHRFDLVVTPRHDYYALTAGGQQEIPRTLRRWITLQEPPGSNVVFTIGALHQADSTALLVAANAWHDELAPLPKPLLVVNIGGPTRTCKYSSDLATQLVGSLQNVLASCGSVIVSFSRRTPKKVIENQFMSLEVSTASGNSLHFTRRYANEVSFGHLQASRICRISGATLLLMMLLKLLLRFAISLLNEDWHWAIRFPYNQSQEPKRIDGMSMAALKNTSDTDNGYMPCIELYISVSLKSVWQQHTASKPIHFKLHSNDSHVAMDSLPFCVRKNYLR